MSRSVTPGSEPMIYRPRLAADRYLRSVRRDTSGMGQADETTDENGLKCEPPAKLRVGKLTMYDGCYDTCGAYWGANVNGIGDMYLAYDQDNHWFMFVRAKSAAHAQTKVKEKFPSAKFVRPLTISDRGGVY